MRDIKETLSSLQYFIDNEFLEKYSNVVERNTNNRFRGSQIHKHHIIPRCWFKLVGKEVNNDLNNLVRLTTRDHFLAHYYLCLCTVDPFKYANELALQCLLSNSKINNVDKLLLQSLPMYNNIYEDCSIKLKSNYKIYKSGKEFHDN